MNSRPGREPLGGDLLFLILLMTGVALILAAIIERIVNLYQTVVP